MDERNLLSRFSRVAPVVEAAVDRIVRAWAPEVPPLTVALAEIGQDIVAQAAELPDETLRAAFALVEDVLTSGTAADQDAVATGLLESVWAGTDDRPVERARILAFLGQQAREYCRAWDRLHGVS